MPVTGGPGLQRLEKLPDLQDRPAAWLLRNLNKVPEAARATVRNNAGGHVNHSLYWRAMSSAGAGAPKGPLADAINRDFGSIEKFKARFAEAGAKLVGSGWVWLASTQQDGGRLVVLTTPGHENPLMQGHVPTVRRWHRVDGGNAAETAVAVGNETAQRRRQETGSSVRQRTESRVGKRHNCCNKRS